ncbi:T9SS type B sorting domain-containing protein, partial [Polaribacter sp.]|nr:T9SS type B sorting domain-containing protein [Polaribacter sp.]
MKKIKTIGLSILLFGISTITIAQNDAPVLNAGATIRQAYCPKTEIVIAPNFTITDADDTGIDSFSIQISFGYSETSDLLDLNLLDHPNIDKDWSPVEGKLKLTPIGGTQILYADLQKAVREVIFTSSSSTISGEKYFSLTIGDANYLKLTDHFYVFESDLDITWTEAKTKAESVGKKYYGLQGYLATILSDEENQISAKQITGTGWIGASDEVNEGVWNWVTGPEAGTNFWNGKGTNNGGSAPIDPVTGNPMYSNWFSDIEPNDFGKNEDYAHIKKNANTWNDLKKAGDGPMSANYRAEGYIVEYGGMPGDPVLNISASTSIYVPEIVTISADKDVCTGTSVNLTATEKFSGTIFWHDALVGGSLVSTGDTFKTPVLNSSKTYYASAFKTDCATSDRLAVVITVYGIPIANIPSDIIDCDDNKDGFNEFDLSNEKDIEILQLNSTPLDFEVLYFDTFTKATNNVTGSNLPNPYKVNTGSSQTIFARVHNKNDNTCFDIVDFDITVTGTPVPKTPLDYAFCDNTSVGSDTDGFVNDFVLESKDLEILGTLDPNQYNVSYHTTQNGAQTNATLDKIPKTSNYKNTTANTQPVYVRVENVDNAACFDASKAFNLIVNKLPVVANSVELLQCDTDPDKKTTFNLTLVEKNISDNPTDTFEYYTTESDAITGTPGALQVADKTSYPVDTSGEAWVRIISEFTCYTISKIELTVSYTPNELYDETFRECDDLFPADGITGLNNDKDGITFFDLSSTPDKISSDLDIIVELYETEDDRTKSSDEIRKRFSDLSKYRNNKIPNTTGNKFPIFYKRISKSNNDCQGIGQFYLQIQSVPIANTPDNFDLCDDLPGNTTDGIKNEINLRNRVNDILGPTQIGLGYVVTFHTSQADADDPTSSGITNDISFSNTPQAGFTAGNISEQTIFVRVKNTAGCISNSTSFKIIVNPIPSISTTITPLAVCDLDADPRNRIAQNIDLTTKSAEILTGKTNHRVAYYLTQPDAQNNIEISNPTDFQNGGVLPDGTALTKFPTDFNTDDPAIQTIFFKIIDLGGNKCASIINTFRLVIYPEPNIPLNISNYSDCDNITDSDADDANGKIGNITLKNKIPEILANYQPTEFADFAVRFYASLTGAEIGDPANALNENTFENSTNGQEIFVRVENIKNTPIVCVNTRLSFNININPLPDFTVRGEENIEDPLIVCLNDTPLTLEAENPVATYAYQWTNQAGDLLGTTATQEVFDAGKYTVTASESVTGCSRERTIVVKESDIATLEQSFITIIDQGNNIGSEDKSSISIDTISNYLGLGDYQFALRNDDENTTTLFQDEPLFENLKGAIYTIIVNDKNGCEPDTTLQVSVLQFPKFFTPNGDGRNDTYRVKGANKTFYPNSSINIFNRYGKLVAQIPIDSQGWDGMYNGKKLSSDDYWYNI